MRWQTLSSCFVIEIQQRNKCCISLQCNHTKSFYLNWFHHAHGTSSFPTTAGHIKNAVSSLRSWRCTACCLRLPLLFPLLQCLKSILWLRKCQCLSLAFMIDNNSQPCVCDKYIAFLSWYKAPPVFPRRKQRGCLSMSSNQNDYACVENPWIG